MSTVANRGTVIQKLAVPAMVAIGGIVAAFFLLRGGDEEQALGLLEEGRPDIGQPAPDFALVDTRDGETVRKLSDFEGKVVVLNWYASWCGPCVQEIPLFQQAQDAIGDDVVFLLVNLQEPQPQALGMLEDLDASMTSVLDTNGDVAERYRVLGMPTTYFIDRDGIVVAGGSGAINEESLRSELARLGLEFRGQ